MRTLCGVARADWQWERYQIFNSWGQAGPGAQDFHEEWQIPIPWNLQRVIFTVDAKFNFSAFDIVPEPAFPSPGMTQFQLSYGYGSQTPQLFYYRSAPMIVDFQLQSFDQEWTVVYQGHMDPVHVDTQLRKSNQLDPILQLHVNLDVFWDDTIINPPAGYAIPGVTYQGMIHFLESKPAGS
jgi:hypothetical protein